MKEDRSMSRRDVLRQGATAVAGGAALLGGAPAFAEGQAPAILTGTQAGRKFRAFLTPPVTGELRRVETIIAYCPEIPRANGQARTKDEARARKIGRHLGIPEPGSSQFCCLTDSDEPRRRRRTAAS